MDSLLKLLNPRFFTAAGILLFLIYAADLYQGYPLQWYERWRYPPSGPSAINGDIAGELDARESHRLRALHRQVSAELAAAAAKGFDTSALQRIADSALKLDTPAYRAAAIERLNKLRLSIPQARERLRPAGIEDGAPDELPLPKSRRPAHRRKR